MWAVWVGARKVVTVMLLQRAGTERQHSSGAHVETVGSQGAAKEDVMTTDDSDVDDGPSEVLGRGEEDVEMGSDGEGDFAEDEAGTGSEEAIDGKPDDEDGTDVVVSNGTEESDTAVESDAEIEAEMMRLVSNVELEIDVGRAELRERTVDETGGCGWQCPRFRCFLTLRASPLAETSQMAIKTKRTTARRLKRV